MSNKRDQAILMLKTLLFGRDPESPRSCAIIELLDYLGSRDTPEILPAWMKVRSFLSDNMNTQVDMEVFNSLENCVLSTLTNAVSNHWIYSPVSK
jgi:hypothetical protein